jgi:hypothetical protein
VQVPIGLEEFHEGVVDIVSRRALHFEGAKGLEMVEGPVPAEMQEEVETRRAELVERVSEVRHTVRSASTGMGWGPPFWGAVLGVGDWGLGLLSGESTQDVFVAFTAPSVSSSMESSSP